MDEFDVLTDEVAAEPIADQISFFVNRSAPQSCLCIFVAILFVEFVVECYTFVAHYKDRSLLAQVKEHMSILREECDALSSIDHLVLKSKKERKINELELERQRLHALVDSSFSTFFKGGGSLNKFLFKKGWEYLSQPILVVVILVVYWGEQLFIFPAAWMYPLSPAYLGSALGWSTVCYRALRRIATSFTTA
jgi:hypothetical protein|eukprot:Stramenopile-MAST_4_protein_3191